MNSTQSHWDALARKSRHGKLVRQVLLIGFLTIVSLPIVVAYLWVVTISFSAKTGGVESHVLWQVLSILIPTVILASLISLFLQNVALRMLFLLAVFLLAIVSGVVLFGDDLHLKNYRFLVNPNLIEDIRGAATAGGQFPWVWEAFGNSLLVAVASTGFKVSVATLAGYYLSRFAFRGREFFLQGLLILEVFHPWMLVIPIFLVIYWVGLLNTLSGPILVLVVIDLPLFIFIMKGFFDSVPWDIEMSAMTDGASRRSAFWYIVLPQVRGGLIAISVLGFIKGWEEYVFVTALRTGNSYWVMSTYLYYVAEDVMGVDYGLVAAVSVIYMLPSLLLYLFLQRYLTQLTLGGIKG